MDGSMIKMVTLFKGLSRSGSSSCALLRMNSAPPIKTFVFLDTETTGLPQWENNQTKITELCMVAIETSHIRLGVFPRVQNKLSLCFNPWKLISSNSEKLTGLSNFLLEHQTKFSSETVRTINYFLNHNLKPICLVAHNGDHFDYPILKAAIDKTDSSLADDIICIDSLQAFREIYKAELTPQITELEVGDSVPVEFTDDYDCLLCNLDQEDTKGEMPEKVLEAKKLNELTPKKQIVKVYASTSSAKKIKVDSSKKLNFNVSFKLTDVYTRLTKRSPIKEHQAEGDVNMLITCAATLGDKFVDWANNNAKKFCDTSPMVPGKKIGT